MPRIRGPADGQGIAAIFDTHKTGVITKESSVLITVSITNEYFCGQWFKAILESAKKKFSKVTILIVDAPNAYNLEADNEYSQKTSEERFSQALRLGEIWWSKNKLYIQDIFGSLSGSTADEQISFFNSIYKIKNPSLEIIRWNDWIKKTNFDLNAIKSKFETDDVLRLAIESSAKSFADRQGLTATASRYAACIRGFKKYLIEEAIGILLLMHDRNYSFVAYPDPMLVALQKTYNSLVSPKSGKNAEKIWLQIDFKRFRTEKQKIAELERNLSKLKVQHHSSTASASNSLNGHFSPVLCISPSFPKIDTDDSQNEALKKELAEMKRTQEQILLQQERIEKLLQQQTLTLQKLIAAKINTSYPECSGSTPNEKKIHNQTTYFSSGVLRPDFLDVLEKHNPFLKKKHETYQLFPPTLSGKDKKRKMQHHSFPPPNPSTL